MHETMPPTVPQSPNGGSPVPESPPGGAFYLVSSHAALKSAIASPRSDRMHLLSIGQAFSPSPILRQYAST
jgi:hypothetical protein